MNYTKVYENYFNKLIEHRNNNEVSIMYPPFYDGEILDDISNNIATVIFTTGTTGTPKGVLHDRDSIDNSIELNTDIFGISSDDILLNYLPTWTIGTYIYTLPTYLKGGTIFHDKFSVDVFKEHLTNNPTTTLLIPTMIDMLIESGEVFDLSSFRNIGTGAEEVKYKHLEYLLDSGAKSVTHIYGSSEAIPATLHHTFHSKDELTLGLKEVSTFEYDNRDSLLLSGVSVANSYYGMGEIELYDSKDNFEIIDGLYFWKNRTDNIVKKKGWKQVVDREFEIIEKEFPEDLNPSKLVWHRDIGDREVTIIEVGSNWKFEEEGRTPRLLVNGDIVYVSKTTLHKIHKGNGGLKVHIKQYK